VDRGDKFLEYEAGCIPEYWLIDPGRKQAEFYQLDEEGHYRAILPDENGVYHSKVIHGFRLRVEWLWQRPLPPVLEVLKELKVI
jgi:Uma2 family endonuclease